MTGELWIALGGFIVLIVTNLIVVIKYITGLELKFNIIKSEIKKEFFQENDKFRMEVAETIKPLRTLVTDYEKKHFELELYIRDHYIEVDTFREALGEIKNLVSDIKDRVEKINDDSVNWRRGKQLPDSKP